MTSLFGIETTESDAAIVLIPVPWEGTVSYGRGTAHGPAAIKQASEQIDLYDVRLGDISRAGIHMLPIPPEFNDAVYVNEYVGRETKRLLDNGKRIGIVGGEHSVPFGAYEQIASHTGPYGILQIDAHMDLRLAYEGYEFSHASIMRNALERVPQVQQLVQVGIRDFCHEELEYAHSQSERVSTFFDWENFSKLANGATWAEITNSIVQRLPEKVWISFDIDGLEPTFCPNTGTPVPGGLSFNQALFVVSAVRESGREIIGFDLCEVAPGSNDDEFDGNVGMRVLYKLCGWLL